MLPAVFARYPLSRQTLVIACDVTAVTVALPLAIMLRENPRPARATSGQWSV